MAQLVIPIDIQPTQLNVYLSASATSIQVASTSGFASTGLLSIGGQETVTYSGISGNTFTGVTRGQYSTDARSFVLGTEVQQALWLATESEVASRNYTIQYRDDGVDVSTKGGIQYIDFTGSSVTASSSVAGVLQVDVSGGSGGLTQPQVMTRTLGG